MKCWMFSRLAPVSLFMSRSGGSDCEGLKERSQTGAAFTHPISTGRPPGRHGGCRKGRPCRRRGRSRQSTTTRRTSWAATAMMIIWKDKGEITFLPPSQNVNAVHFSFPPASPLPSLAHIAAPSVHCAIAWEGPGRPVKGCDSSDAEAAALAVSSNLRLVSLSTAELRFALARRRRIRESYFSALSGPRRRERRERRAGRPRRGIILLYPPPH